MMSKLNTLLMCADESSRTVLAEALKEFGYNIIEESDGHSAFMAISRQDISLIITDEILPDMSAMDFIRAVNKLFSHRRLYTVVIFQSENICNIQHAFTNGASDCLIKPISVEDVRVVISRLSAKQSDQDIAIAPFSRQEWDEPVYPLSSLPIPIEHLQLDGTTIIQGLSGKMREVFSFADILSTDRSIPVFIQGETGTGKEILAKFIHHRKEDSGPFVAINCAALTPSIFESELFGYEAGTFTGGSAKGQIGKFELARGGTVFLDEITEIPTSLQAKLLRVIEEKDFYKVGGTKKVSVDARIIASTNCDIKQVLTTGQFRSDLYYRFNVGHIYLPPLRERAEEILPMATLFLTSFAKDRGKCFRYIDPEAAQLLLSYSWPGNIRELKNTMQRVVLMWDDYALKPCHLGFIKKQASSLSFYKEFESLLNSQLPSDKLPIEKLYDHLILKALEQHNGNQSKTAQYLGISRNSLVYRLKKIRYPFQSVD